MRMRTLTLAALLISGTFLASCSTGGGGTVTKQSLCIDLTGAYCSRSVKFGCPGATDCAAQNRLSCASLFDGTCTALPEMKDKVSHDITNIIRTKDSCESLVSVDGYLNDTIADLQASACDNLQSF